MVSLFKIFGQPISNKNIAMEIAQFLEPKEVFYMVKVSKKCNIAYRQDVIWWRLVHFHLSHVRCVDNKIFTDSESRYLIADDDEKKENQG